MYNLNVNVSSAAAVNNLLGVEGSCSTTPRTPEILNSLIAMSNPFEGLTAGAGASLATAATPASGDSSNSCSPLASPTQAQSPPSVQHTCSQLIKEGLKLTIQTKRRQTGQPLDLLPAGPPPKLGCHEEVSHHYHDDYDEIYSPGIGLTPEDEERRRRRRERNKIAATKCRLKKRERTHNLVQESEVLESQNHELKSQIQELESQRRRLVDMLSVHTPTCMRNSGTRAPFIPSAYPALQELQTPSAGYEPHCGLFVGYASSPVDHGCMA